MILCSSFVVMRNYMIENKIILTFFIVSLACVKLMATEQRYTLKDSGERVFLVDNQTGAVWRYYFNTREDQGWDITYFGYSKSDSFTRFQLSPEGEVISFPRVKIN